MTFTPADRPTRIAKMLVEAVCELHEVLSPHTVLALIRGLALQAQALRMSPATFDCPNGRDAMAAIALSQSRAYLTTLSKSNALVLGARWSSAVYIASLLIPGPAIGSAERHRAADVEPSKTHQWAPAKVWRAP